MLRKAREATGLHIAALAVAMKVPVKKLEALEADRLEELPDAVFTRALAASMCRALKMDPAPVLSRLPQTAAPKFDRDDRGINMPYSASGLPFGGSLRSLASRPAVLLVSALLLAALAVVFYPVARNVETSPAASKASNVPAAVPAEVGKLVAANAETVASNVQPAPAPAVAVDVVTPSAAPVPAAAASLAAGVIASAAGTVPNVVVFKATSSAWVRVSDSKGVLQFEKTLDAGETAGASGTPPLSIVVGNVGATEVMVRGQPFRLDEFAKNNVARFEVK
jgi:cytoskeleton protein RodZ